MTPLRTVIELALNSGYTVDRYTVNYVSLINETFVRVNLFDKLKDVEEEIEFSF